MESSDSESLDIFSNLESYKVVEFYLNIYLRYSSSSFYFLISANAFSFSNSVLAYKNIF